MQWLNSLTFGDNRALQVAVLAGIVIVAIIALIIAYRALFGHRLRFSTGGKARQPRLGLVDAFSLDGQRQLVIVRRDNVEHLLMIGGPNDIVVESQIVRTQPQSQSQTASQREKDPTIAPAAPAAPKPVAAAQPAPQALPQPQPQPAPQLQPAMKVVAAPTVAPLRPVSPPPAIAIPAPRAPIRPEPPAAPVKAPLAAAPPPASPTSPASAPVAPPPIAPPGPTLAPRPQLAPESVEARAPAKPTVLPLPLPLRPANPTPKASSLPPPIVVASAPTPAKPVVVPAPPTAPAPIASVQKSASAPAGTRPEGKGDPFAGLDSLEAEMARLLGRDP